MSPEGQSTNPVNTAPLIHDRYEVGERVAEGTFFFTHRARDVQTGRAVALKVLKPEYAADDAFTSRLAAESRSVVTLQHPNIAQVYDVFRHQNTLVIVTEWVRGMNLQDRIRRVAPFPLAVAMDIFQASAEALHYAHENGFIHGDIRPENVIITPDGRVKITDFGVGSSAAATTRTQLSSLQRTANYLAPEVAQGHAVDARTDVYSLGCVLFEMLTGTVPFPAETPLAVAVKHLNDPVPSPRERNHAVPNAVDGITRKCMLKDPMSRYLSLPALLQDVRAVQDAIRNERPLTWTPLKEAPEAPAAPERPKARAAEPTKQRAAPAPPPVRPPDDREGDGGPGVKVLVGIAAVGVAIMVAFFLAVNSFLSAPPVVTVPGDLIGMQRTQAEAALAKADLKVDVREDFRENIPEGKVYQSAPPPGTELRAGKTVILYVSRGPEPITVPDVTGKTLSQARQELAAAGLNMGKPQEEWSEVIEKGQVISQNPVGGAETKKKSAVTLVLSKGPEPVPEPREEPAPAEEPTPEPAIPDTAQELPHRDMVVEVRIPASYEGPQKVTIISRGEDGSENTVYEAEHQPGERIEPVVTVIGNEGKAEIEVYINGRLTRKTKV